MIKKILTLVLVAGVTTSAVQAGVTDLGKKAIATTPRRAALVGGTVAATLAGRYAYDLYKADGQNGKLARMKDAATSTKNFVVNAAQNEYQKAKAAFGENGSWKAKAILAAKLAGILYAGTELVQFVRQNNGPAAYAYNKFTAKEEQKEEAPKAAEQPKKDEKPASKKAGK